MHTAAKSSLKPYAPSGVLGSSDYFDAPGFSRVYNAQFLRDNIRRAHPPALHLDDKVLEEGLEKSNEFLSGNSDSAMEEPEDGVISPLELPPRLLSFTVVDRGDDSALWGPPPELDLAELDRRLESIARIQRLERAGLLHEFFAFVNATRA